MGGKGSKVSTNEAADKTIQKSLVVLSPSALIVATELESPSVPQHKKEERKFGGEHTFTADKVKQIVAKGQDDLLESASETLAITQSAASAQRPKTPSRPFVEKSGEALVLGSRPAPKLNPSSSIDIARNSNADDCKTQQTVREVSHAGHESNENRESQEPTAGPASAAMGDSLLGKKVKKTLKTNIGGEDFMDTSSSNDDIDAESITEVGLEPDAPVVDEAPVQIDKLGRRQRPSQIVIPAKKKRVEEVHDWCEEPDEEVEDDDAKAQKVELRQFASAITSVSLGSSDDDSSSLGRNGEENSAVAELKDDEVYDWCTAEDFPPTFSKPGVQQGMSPKHVKGGEKHRDSHSGTQDEEEEGTGSLQELSMTERTAAARTHTVSRGSVLDPSRQMSMSGGAALAGGYASPSVIVPPPPTFPHMSQSSSPKNLHAIIPNGIVAGTAGVVHSIILPVDPVHGSIPTLGSSPDYRGSSPPLSVIHPGQNSPSRPASGQIRPLPPNLVIPASGITPTLPTGSPTAKQQVKPHPLTNAQPLIRSGGVTKAVGNLRPAGSVGNGAPAMPSTIPGAIYSGAGAAPLAGGSPNKISSVKGGGISDSLNAVEEHSTVSSIVGTTTRVRPAPLLMEGSSSSLVQSPQGSPQKLGPPSPGEVGVTYFSHGATAHGGIGFIASSPHPGLPGGPAPGVAVPQNGALSASAIASPAVISGVAPNVVMIRPGVSLPTTAPPAGPVYIATGGEGVVVGGGESPDKATALFLQQQQFMLFQQQQQQFRDTKVVKKKKVDLPKGHLPHPTPKFGDWLSSRVMINNYIVLESLGKGSFAEVRLCKEKASDKLYALKIIDRQNMKGSTLGKKQQQKFEDIKREIEIMKLLNHQNVLRLYEVMDDPKVNKLYLVIEYMELGDLVSMQKDGNKDAPFKPLTDTEIWTVLKQVVEGLKYLHDKKVVHGDIKPQNLLVGEGGVVKIADFGISQTLFASKQKLTDVAGTPAFMSPEMCSGEEYSGQLADIWALGGTIYMLKFGSPPFVASSILQLYQKIQNDPLVFPVPRESDPDLEDLLSGMLIKPPPQRFTLEDVMKHKWLQVPPICTVAPKTVHLNSIGGTLDSSKVVEETEEVEEVETREARDTNIPDSAGGFAAAVAAATANKSMSADEEMQRSVKFQFMASQKSLPKQKVTARRPSADDEEEEEEEDSDGLGDEEADRNTRILSSEEVEGADIKKDSVEVVNATIQDSPRLQELLTTLQMSSSLLDDEEEEPMAPGADSPGIGSTATSTPSFTSLSFDTLQCDSSQFNEALGIRCASLSLQGKRGSQEDRVQVIPDLATFLKSRTAVTVQENTVADKNLAYFGVFDGHGGELCSDFLWENLHAYIVAAVEEYGHSSSDWSSAIISACARADKELCQLLVERNEDCGSTATFGILDGTTGTLWVANVGDCRCVVSKKGGRAQDLTYDHKLIREDERSRVKAAGGWITNERINGVLAVSRAFGDREFKASTGPMSSDVSAPVDSSSAVKDMVTAVPEITHFNLAEGAEFIVLACDGVWDVFSSQDVVDFIRKRLAKHRDVNRTARELAEEALRKFSADNISVVIVVLSPHIYQQSAAAPNGDEGDVLRAGGFDSSKKMDENSQYSGDDIEQLVDDSESVEEIF